MNMAKASEADLRMAMELSTALECLERYRSMPSQDPDDITEEAVPFDRDDAEDCKKALNKVLDITSRGSLFRVIFGMVVLLDPQNKVLDPNADILALHPDLLKDSAPAKEAGLPADQVAGQDTLDKGSREIVLRGGVNAPTKGQEGVPN